MTLRSSRARPPHPLPIHFPGAMVTSQPWIQVTGGCARQPQPYSYLRRLRLGETRKDWRDEAPAGLSELECRPSRSASFFERASGSSSSAPSRRCVRPRRGSAKPRRRSNVTPSGAGRLGAWRGPAHRGVAMLRPARPGPAPALLAGPAQSSASSASASARMACRRVGAGWRGVRGEGRAGWAVEQLQDARRPIAPPFPS